ncbi:hypothetical protein KIW84_051583 [Lathyrus oleraceus]|uniref:Uncharacterized protein n=1 Tax=Pisum sativum TaxID=3888 RepID=A0A9D4WKD5_PEA|nr:hypothetical protein KIW84_051583 [Pisum sativum]
MSVADEFTKNSLVIYVQGLSDNFNPGVANIDVISRITYEVSNVNYDIKSLKTTPRNETCIIEANLSRSNVMTPKILTASDIIEKFPQEWILQDVVKSEKIEARTIRDVIQDIDGYVRIRMNRSQSYRYHQSSSIGSTSSARHSVDSTIRVNLAGVNFAPTKVLEALSLSDKAVIASLILFKNSLWLEVAGKEASNFHLSNKNDVSSGEMASSLQRPG